jgi:chemotaxis protein methyltransferase CheR
VYTLAAIWKLQVQSQFPGVSLHIVATDSEENMLARAQEACYFASSLKDFPSRWLQLAFEQKDDLYCVRPALRDAVEFVLQDIRYEMPAGKFDLILCRHVAFTYFDEPLQRQMLKRLVAKLPLGGILVTGKQEPLPGGCFDLEEFRPRMGIYCKGSNH